MNSRKQKEAPHVLPAHRTAESGKNMATIIPALYYSTPSFRMEGFL